MGSTYTHLSIHERRQLFHWRHEQDWSSRKIAHALGRSHTSISREIKRHMSETYVSCYYPNPAQHDYGVMTRRRGQRQRLKSPETRSYVADKLRLGWSPEIISGRLRAEKALPYVCHEAIYQFIYKESPDLIAALPRKHKKRRIKRPYRSTPAHILNRVNIAARSAAANERSEGGHWESDSIVSAGHKPGCNVIVERMTRLTHITKLPAQTASETTSAIITKLAQYPSGFVRSITYDNGSENAQHLTINKALSCHSFFCNPYHSWEKGSVEQTNGLIRRYLPKNTDITQVSEEHIQHIEHMLNTRPRKCLGFKSPIEAYRKFEAEHIRT